MNPTLKYTDNNDKCYGLAGMAIGLFIYDGENYLSAISLDTEPENAITFSPDFYFSGNPRMSAKNVWNHLLKQYEISTGMTISNVLCRYLAGRHTDVTPDVRSALLQAVTDEGKATCSLDDDEINAIFNKGYGYLTRVFSHRAVQGIVNDFARRLNDRRTLSHDEITDILRALQMI